MSDFMADVVAACGCRGGLYAEPYSGGAGVALRLLYSGAVSRILINDLNPAVFAFWNSVVNNSDAFLDVFDSTEVTLDEWRRQRAILAAPASELELGFAFFFINRTCRSGVASGGVIGGLRQDGRYRVDARYNRSALREKLLKIARYSSSISVSNKDGMRVIDELSTYGKSFLYVDPPYVAKGGSLYLNSFDRSSHVSLAKVLLGRQESRWLLTYDDHSSIRGLYGGNVVGAYPLTYSAYRRRLASELMITSNAVKLQAGHLFKEA